VQLAKFGFDLSHGHRCDLRVPSQVIPQRVAECEQDVFPARPAVDLVNVRVGEQLRVSLTELFNVDFG
jgi:hypothetical protein